MAVSRTEVQSQLRKGLGSITPMLVGGVHWDHWVQEGVRALGMGDTVGDGPGEGPDHASI